MAKAGKRKVPAGASGGGAGSPDRSGSSSGRVTPPKASAQRYTPPVAKAGLGPSPRWVPILMFSLWGLGLLVIILNYMMVLPGTADGGNGWYLVAGLLAILAGIITATRYR